MRLGSTFFEQPGQVLKAGSLVSYIFYYGEMSIQPVQIVPKQRINVPAREELMPLVVGYELEKIEEVCEFFFLIVNSFANTFRICWSIETLAHFHVR
jgi:hypothetical protein